MDEKRFITILWIAKAALVAVLLYVGVGVVVNRMRLNAMFDPDTASGELRVAETQAAPTDTHSPSDYEAIVQRNLFSDADTAAARQPDANRAPAVPSVPSADDLGLRLVGTIAGGPAASRAIIQSTKSSTSDFYRIGDIVASATVEAIQRGEVVLRCQGRILVLKQCSGTTVNKGQQKTEAAVPNVDNRSQPLPVATAPSSESSRTGSMSEIFRKATIEPYVKNDRTEGLKITGLDRIPLAEAFGFKNGDIVQTVNGQQLTSKQKAFQVLQKARTQPRVDIRILRDGKSKELSFDL
ncbi:MAG: PDZ domain-containing protein [Planctomycetes bacterium]|nr:PDZ domain-containing protein [Planctomycetota bacterium]